MSTFCVIYLFWHTSPHRHTRTHRHHQRCMYGAKLRNNPYRTCSTHKHTHASVDIIARPISAFFSVSISFLVRVSYASDGQWQQPTAVATFANLINIDFCVRCKCVYSLHFGYDRLLSSISAFARFLVDGFISLRWAFFSLLIFFPLVALPQSSSSSGSYSFCQFFSTMT